MLLEKVVSAAVPAMIAVAAFFQAHAVGSLVDASIPPAAIAPFAEARAATSKPAARSGHAILERNVFDSTARPEAETTSDAAPPCDGVRAVVTVRADSPDGSFAALDVRGKRHLRRRGGEVEDLRVVDVGDDRVWLARDGALCEARIFAPPPPPRTSTR
jgi:hypothetical protein